MAAKILLLDELLNSSSSSSEEEMMAVLMQNEMRIQIPKVRNMMDIINEYSDKRYVILYVISIHILSYIVSDLKYLLLSFSDIFV